MSDFEKSGPVQSHSAFATGVKEDAPYDDIEHSRKGSRRKSSIVAAIKENYGIVEEQRGLDDSSSIKRGQDFTHRKLKPRHIQLIGIGGTIGTALYVNIGRGVLNGGPASLFMAFSIWYVTLNPCDLFANCFNRCSVIMMVTNCKIHEIPLVYFQSNWKVVTLFFAALKQRLTPSVPSEIISGWPSYMQFHLLPKH